MRVHVGYNSISILGNISELVKYSGGSVVVIKTSDKTNFKITPEQLKKAITPKSKILILTIPIKSNRFSLFKRRVRGYRGGSKGD